jgi:uncharacterized repeat protein (TIGR01451 family)
VSWRFGTIGLFTLFLLGAIFWWLAVVAHPLQAAGSSIRYVATTGDDQTGTNTCLYNYAPCATIQQAIQQASAGDEIRVAAGTYTGTGTDVLSLNKDLTLRGGFTTGNWLIPDPTLNSTIINGQNTRRVILVNTGITVEISGFELTGGNTASFGAGVYNLGNLLLLEDVKIYNNTTSGSGAGLANGLSSVTAAALILRNSEIYNNNTTGTGFGGGIYIGEGTALIEAVQIYDNSAPRGGGVAAIRGNSTIRNSLIYNNNNNHATVGAGGMIVGGFASVIFENNTVYNNQNLNATGPGGGISVGGVLTVTNSLIVGNSANSEGGIDLFGTPTLTVNYTDYYNNSPDDGYTTGTGNRTATNPNFVNAAGGDFHLNSGSPAIDAAIDITGLTDDYEGRGRPFDDTTTNLYSSAIDRGASEYITSSSCYARIEDGAIFTSPQTAVNAAVAGDTIQIAGTCTGVSSGDPHAGAEQALYVSKSLIIRGGYALTDWVNPTHGPTTLDANNGGRVIYVAGSGVNVVIENLHITGGQLGGSGAADGAGIQLANDGGATLRNNAIYGNTRTGGGAVYGGAVYNGGVSGALLLDHNTIYGNSATFGGGVYAAGSGGAVTINNTIIATNTAVTAGGDIYSPTAGKFTLNYNDFYGNSPVNTGITLNATNLTVPPGFTNAGADDFHLDYDTSSVTNRADPASSVTTDFDGEERPQGTVADMGADESPYYIDVLLSQPPPFAITSTTLYQGKTITFTHYITNSSYTPNATESFNILTSNNNGWAVNVVGVSLPIVLAPGASNSFQVIVTVPATLTGAAQNITLVTAVPTSNPGRYAQANDVISTPGVELGPTYPPQNADPGTVVTFTHFITNTGAQADTFLVTLDSPFGWWELITPPSPATITLGAGQSGQVIIRVTVGSTAIAGLNEVIDVTAESLNYDVSATVVDTVIANAISSNRYVAPPGQDTNNNCSQPAYPCKTVSHAVSQANFDRTVFVAQGTYNESSTLAMNQRIYLRGGYNFSGGFGTGSFSTGSGLYNPTVTIIDFQNSGRGINIQTPVGFSPLIRGFTIRNTSTSGVGGGIYVQSLSDPTLQDLIIENGSASRGGGIYVDQGSPLLERIVITDTTATNQGGGLYINSGFPTLNTISILNATAGNQGGGLYVNTGGTTAWNTGVIDGNTATTGDGGGIYLSQGSLSWVGLDITNNTAGGRGGGLYQAAGTLTISQTVLGGNRAATSGGGLYSAGSTLRLWNNYIYDNTATAGSGGGLYYTGSGTLSLWNDSLHNNQAGTNGGGIYDNNSSSLTLHNMIIAENIATSGGGIYRNSAGAVSVDYNDYWNNTGGDRVGVVAGANSISADPLFVDIALNDYQIVFASPAVDTGDPATFLTTDHEDDPRPVNQGYDMGADEAGGCLITNLNTTDVYGVLQLAIDEAGLGHTLQISGVCRGVQSRLAGSQTISQSAFINRNVTLLGADSSAAIDATGLGRVLVISSTNASVVVQRLILLNGDAAAGGGTNGGGILYTGGSQSLLQVVNTTITNSQAIYGGGLYSSGGGDLELRGTSDTARTTFQNNTASFGGGVYIDGGSITLNYVTFEGNTATTGSGFGGGLYQTGASASLTMDNTKLNNNTALRGGGVYVAGGLVSGELIHAEGNSAAYGGGFYNLGTGRLWLARSVIISNSTSSNHGAGLYNASGGTLAMTNTIIAHNTSAGDGGGLYGLSANLSLYHNVFYANRAIGQGGGVYHASSGGAAINSNSFVSNISGSGGSGIHIGGATSPAFDYNNVYGNTNSGATGTANIAVNPGFVSLVPTSNFFLRVATGSPVEDKGDPNSPVTNDIDDKPRPSNQAVDIGINEVGNCFIRNQRTSIVYGSPQVAANNSINGDILQVAGTCQGVNSVVDTSLGQTVTQTLFLNKSLTLRGGYDSNNWNTTPNPILRPTIFDALNRGRVLYITNTVVISVYGLHLRQGNADLGGHIPGGGAIFVGSGTLSMTNNLVYSSTATNVSGGGGALYNQGGTVRIYIENEFYSNQASRGGAFYQAGGSIILDDNTIRNNSATSGGAFYHAGGASTLQNLIIRNNSATSGGGVYNNGTSSLRVRHNTFYQNSATSGGGLYNNTASSQIAVVNNIFHTNTATNGHAVYSGASLSPRYNNAYPAANAYAGGVAAGTGSLSVDSQFLAPTLGDFHLLVTSPVLDKGDPTMDPIFDFEGHLRPGDQGFDMGADELLGCLAQNQRTLTIYGNPQRAIDESIPGDEIRVASGYCRGVHSYNGSPTIKQTIHISHSLSLFGQYRRPAFVDPFRGYGGANFVTQENGGVPPTIYGTSAVETIITPTLQGRAMLITNSATVQMEGFDMFYGDATGQGGTPLGDDAGGGIYIAPGSNVVELNYVMPHFNRAEYGAGIYNAGTRLLLRGLYSTGNNASVAGGAIFNETGVITVTTDGASPDGTSALNFATSIWDNTAISGGGIFNYNGTVNLINDVEGTPHQDGDPDLPEVWDAIFSNSAEAGGGIFNGSSGFDPTITAHRFKIDDNSAYFGGGIYNDMDGTLTLSPRNQIYNNQATYTVSDPDSGKGGGILNLGTLTLDRGNLLHSNSAEAQGGAIYNDGTLTAWNTMAYYNDAIDSGGAFYLTSDATSELLHNTIDNNSASPATTGRGGAIYIQGGTPTLKNNIFSNNTAKEGSAIYVAAGTPTIDYNDYWPGDGTAQIQGGSPGANDINVNPSYIDGLYHISTSSGVQNVAEPGLVNQDFEDDPRPGNGGWDMGADENGSCLAQVANTGSVYGSIQAAIDAALSGYTIRVEQGTCYESLDIDKQLTIIGGWVKDTNFTTASNSISTYVDARFTGRPVATITSTVTLQWLQLTNGITSNPGAGIYQAGTGGALNLTSVNVISNSTTSTGGGIYQASGAGTLTLNRVSIAQNGANVGGGLYIRGNTIFNTTTSSSSVNNNTSTTLGGGVYVDTGGRLTLGGTDMIQINSNQASDGGGIYIAPGNSLAVTTLDDITTLNLDGNTATGSGGAIYNDDGSYFRLIDGRITINNNRAVGAGQNGGAIYNGIGSSARLVGDTATLAIANNTSGGDGGGLYNGDNSNVTLSNVSISGNTADGTGGGGGLYNDINSFVDLTTSGISGNEAPNGNGGGLYNAPGSEVVAAGGLGFYFNESLDGGGVYNDGATLTIRNKRFTDNAATSGKGGAIYATTGSDLTLTNILFYNNTAVTSGGAIYHDNTGGTSRLYHATINENAAPFGGAVYNVNGTMNISSSIVSFNDTTDLGSFDVHQVGGTVNLRRSLLSPGTTHNGSAALVITGDPLYYDTEGAYLSQDSPAIDAVPSDESHVIDDAYSIFRPQLCDKDMGRNEYYLGGSVPALTWDPAPVGQTILPGNSVVYDFTLTNNTPSLIPTLVPPQLTGNGYTQTITLTLNTTGSWGQQIIAVTGGATNLTIVPPDKAYFELGPGESVEISVQVTVPAGTTAGQVDTISLTYNSEIDCLGTRSGTSGSVNTTVGAGYNFIIAPNNFGFALPGQTITYTHTITNLGNIADTYTLVPNLGLYASSVSISPLVPNPLPLAPGGSQTFEIYVTISDMAAGGLPIPDTSGVIGVSQGSGSQKAGSDNTTIGYTTGDRYVSLAGNNSEVDETLLTGEDYDDNNCTRPDVNSCRTIQHAIDQASPGDRIKVDQGVYGTAFVDVLTRTLDSGEVITQVAYIDKAIMLQGGYDRNVWENPPNPVSYTTTLDPSAVGGRAIYVITTTDVVTIDRLALVNGDMPQGGALYKAGGTLLLNANRISDNAAATGGGLYSVRGDLILRNNLLHDNAATTQGGAVYANNGTATLQNNTFYQNSAPSGGAVYIGSGGDLTMVNNIVAEMTGGAAVYVQAPGSATMDYNLYYNNSSNTGGTAGIGTSDILGQNPLFVNSLLDPPDLSIAATSPARDTGQLLAAVTEDYTGSPRPLGATHDIGAFERIPLQSLLFEPDVTLSVLAGDQVVATHILTNTGDIADTFIITATPQTAGWSATYDQPLPYTINLGPGMSQTVVVTYQVPTTAAGQIYRNYITATSSSLSTVFDRVIDTMTVRVAAWSINKTVTPAGTIFPGGTLTYTIYITNSGDLATSGAYTITDPLPNNTYLVQTIGPAPIQTSPNLVWAFSSPLAPGAGINVTFVVTVETPLADGTAIVNDDYRVTGGGAVTGTVGPPVTVTVDAPATLSITKTVGLPSVAPGQTLVYTITVTNDGSSYGPATGVVVTDSLPANFVYQSMGFVAPATGMTISGGDPLLEWQFSSSIPVGGSAQVYVIGRLDSPLATPDNLVNNFGAYSDNAPVVVDSLTTPIIATNAITVSKTVAPTSALPGDDVTYTIVLTNTGNGIPDVTLTDLLGASFSPSTELTTLPVPGRDWFSTEGVTTYSFTATAPAAPGIYYNQAITATYDTGQATLYNTAPLEVRLPGPPILSFSKTADPITDVPYHGAVAYTLQISNTGESDAIGVLITDTLPAGVAFGGWTQQNGANQSGGQITWNGTVNRNQTITIIFTVNHTGNYGDVITNTAQFGHSSGSGSDQATFTVIGSPEVTLTPTSLNFGQVVVGTTSPAQTVILTNTGAAPLDITNITNTGPFNINETCPASLTAGQSCTIEVFFSPTAVGLANGILSIFTNAGTSPDTVLLTGEGVPPPPALAISKAVWPTTNVPYHGAVTYTVIISNTGGQDATGVLLTDTLPVSVTFDHWVQQSGANQSGGQITWNGTVTAGASITFIFVANHTGDYEDVVVNTVQYAHTTSSNTAQATFTVIAPPEATLLPATLNFGTQLVGTTSAAQAATLANIGGEAFNVTNITISGPFSIAAENCPASLAGGNNCQIDITFSPTAVGPATGVLTVTTNIGGSTAYTVTLTGSGTNTPPSLSITKSVTPDTDVAYHGAVTYTIEIDNAGSNADGVLLTDTLPISVAFDHWVQQQGAVENGGQITWSGTVTGGQAVTLIFVVNHTGDYGDVVNNMAEYTHSSGSSWDDATFTVVGPPSIGLSILKSATPTTNVTNQGEVTYTIQVANTGLDDATGVLITDTLPVSVTFDHWVQQNGASVAGDEITWNGTVAAGNAVTITFVVRHTGNFGDVVINTAEYEHTTGSGSDTASFTVGGGPSVDLSTGTIDFGNQEVGTTGVTRTIRLRNTGSGPLVINDITVDNSADFNLSHNCPPILAAGDSCTIQVSFGPDTTGAKNGTVTIDTNAPTSPDTITLIGNGTPPQPNLSIGKTATPNTAVAYHGEVTYTITLTNAGSVDANSVTLTDTLPSGVAFDRWVQQSGAITAGPPITITWNGTVAANSSISISFVVSHTGNYGDIITNTAEYSHTSSSNTAQATFTVVVADVGISKTVTPTIALPGQIVTYTIAFSNSGNITATGVRITDTLPATLTNLSAISSGVGLTDLGGGVWQVEDLAPGASGLLTITGQVNPALAADTTFTNTAWITADNETGATTNNSSAAPLSVTVPRVQFSDTTYAVAENNGPAVINVTLSLTNPHTAVTVVYSTTDATATAGSDYTSVSNTLTISAGLTQASFTVPVTDDAVSENVESLLLELSSPTGAMLGAPISATLFITDDEESIIVTPTVITVAEGGITDTYQVLLRHQPTATVTVTATPDGQTTVAPTALTFTPATWDTPQTVTVTAVDDTLNEGLHNGLIAHTAVSSDTTYNGIAVDSVTAFIEDNDAPPIIYIPLLYHQTEVPPPPPQEPDLVVSNITLTPSGALTTGQPVEIEFTVTNQGTGPADSFWVELYINPSIPITTAGYRWWHVCGMDPCYGITWGVDYQLQPGESVTLVSTGGYSDTYTIWPGHFASGTTDLYIYADMFGPLGPDGNVAESNETNNRAELHSLSVTGANVVGERLPDINDIPDLPMPGLSPSNLGGTPSPTPGRLNENDPENETNKTRR